MVKPLVGPPAELPREPLPEEGLVLQPGHQAKMGPEVRACLNNKMRSVFKGVIER